MLLKNIKAKLCLNASAAMLTLGFVHSVHSLELAQSPLFLAQPVKPIVMLNMSNDHQLFFKAYDDYTDLTGDKIPDTTYEHSHDYYGYFDSNKCYKYQNSRFEPIRETANKYCNDGANSGEWSGNFLNWATMTRVDTVRKILYGGKRSTDGDKDGITVLERALLPHDAHSFAKYYDSRDIPDLTPFARPNGSDNKDDGITICNTTDGSGYSQSVDTATSPPQMRVAAGNFSLWASNERWQCRWGTGSNDNDSERTGIDAYSASPTIDENALGDGDYNVRVKVCAQGLLESNCLSYPDGNSKPTGLLQKYGQQGQIQFGLITGSYAKNKSGGVLRKNVAAFSDEVFADTDGRFKSDGNGIVKTLDSLRIHGYDYSDGLYDHTLDNCPFGLTGFEDGKCSNWGNPQSEIYLESLRYLAGLSAQYDANDTDYIAGIPAPSWNPPVTSENYCAALNVIQFNASSSSYDDVSGSVLGLNELGSLDGWTNKVSAAEGIDGGNYFVGESGADGDQLCTAKEVAGLSSVAGTCPDAPRLEGTYDIVGLAHYARSSKIHSSLNVEPVKTYGVALASATPSVSVPVPGSDNQIINILPACKNDRWSGGVREGNCAIVDFKIVEQTFQPGVNSGKLYVNWEAAEQGGDFDSDMWGVLDYSVTSTQVTISTEVMAASSGRPLSFGYVLSGTSADGFNANSGINWSDSTNCYDDGNGHCIENGDPQTYSIGMSSASLLESPLYYAAKWGGFSNGENGEIPSDSEIAASDPETYFFAIDPAKLEENLSEALEQVAAEAGSASSVATNSTRLGTDTVIYQALFDSSDWSGEVKALNLRSDGSVGTVKWQSGDDKIDSPDIRKVFTHDGTSGIAFAFDELSNAQKAALMGVDDATTASAEQLQDGAERVSWVKGSSVDGLRARNSLLGDIVNSSPVFAGRKKFNFHLLSEDLGGLAYETYYTAEKQPRREVLYVGANDGMLHAFDATSGQELFAYVPAGIYEKLRKLSSPDYGGNNNPHTYSVDGKLFVGDVYTSSGWKNVLVGTLGAGGKGLFVLDITNPTTFSESDVLLDLTDEDLYPDTFSALGQITSEPTIAPTNKGWKIIFGNGYNSSAGTANLFAIDIDDPLTESEIIPAGTSGANGLAGPALLPGGDGKMLAAYAGDLLGNMWKFDLTGNNWGIPYKSGNDGVPLFNAAYETVDADGNDVTKIQPITATPTLGLNAKMENAVMVYFGTGSYLASSDNEAGDTINTFYAIADTGEEVTGRDQLFAKTISTEADGVREVDGNAATGWWVDKKGWYLDLTLGGSVTGERVISKPLLIYDRLLFPTMITSSDPCSFGGSGWLMELVAVGDRYEGHSIFGEDGIEVDYAVISYSDVIRSGEKAYLPTSNIKGELDVEEGDFPSEAVGRMSWRQLR